MQKYDNLVIERKKCITDRINIKIERGMLERNPDGITVIDCVNVTIRRGYTT